MATTPAGHTTPKDFFLWLGAIIAFYASITSFLTLLFQYINYTYPDALAGYGDPYGTAVRTSMAILIVLAPTAIVLFSLIRRTIRKDASKATIWARRWAVVLTLFIAAAVALIDLITLINTFLGGEITTRFTLKALVVLLVAVGVLLHFVADMKGYWKLHPRRAQAVGVGFGVLALVTVIAGFFIIGTPSDMRDRRFDEQKVWDLQGIQYQIVNHWQTHGELPETLDELSDPLSSYMVPVDAETGAPYEYRVTKEHTFSLCADFNQESVDMKGRGEFARGTAYPSYDSSFGVPMDESFVHGAGLTCFERTIDPKRYPLFERQPMPVM